MLAFYSFFSPRAQKKQRGVGEGEAEGGGSGQHEGAQPAAVLHLQGMAQQVQHIRRTGANQQPHISVSARRCVPPPLDLRGHIPAVFNTRVNARGLRRRETLCS